LLSCMALTLPASDRVNGMAIRLRWIEGTWIALCAVESDAKPGDLYLDDAQHGALADKFASDWQGQIVDWSGTATAMRLMAQEKVRDAHEEFVKWEAAGRPCSISSK
jgi:hypothetical protein